MKIVPLSEVCLNIVDCPHSTPEWKNEGKRVIRNFNIVDGRLDFSTPYYVDEETYRARTKRAVPKYNNIVFSREAPIGKCALIPEGFVGCLGQRLVLLIVNKSVCSPEYLLIALQSPFVLKQIEHMGSSGSIVSNFGIGDLKNLQIPIVDNQDAVVNMIKPLNDKIALNNSICSNLESMAKTIYDYWFLQFEFANEDGKPYKSSGGKMVWNDELKREIPEGWKVEPLFQCMDVTYGYPLSTNFFNQEEGTPVIRIRDILDNSTSAYTTEKISDKYISESKDLLIGMDGNFHMNYCCEDGQYINQRIVRIREKDNISTMQVCFEIAPYIKKKEQNVARSTVGHLSDKDLKSIYILNSNNSHIYKVFNGFLEKICTARKENKKLTALRDFLLPMLMNGQVTFKEEA